MALNHTWLKTWIKWWDARKGDFVPAFCGEGIPGSNMAEVIHSVMMRGGKVWLVNAAFADVSTFINQDVAYQGVLDGTVKSTGKAPSIRKRTSRDLKKQLNMADQIAEAILQGDLQKENQRQQELFVAQETAGHKVPKKFSILNPTEADEGPQKKKKKTVRFEKVLLQDEDNNIEEIEITVESEEETDENDAIQSLTPTTPKSKKKKPASTFDTAVYGDNATRHMQLNADRIARVVYLDNNIKKCTGCQTFFNKKKLTPPNDMVFQFQTKRTFVSKGVLQTAAQKYTAYYHLHHLNCLRKKDPAIEKNHLYMCTEEFNKLTEQHKNILMKHDYYRFIVANRAANLL